MPYSGVMIMVRKARPTTTGARIMGRSTLTRRIPCPRKLLKKAMAKANPVTTCSKTVETV
jgi:hypothetical protein